MEPFLDELWSEFRASQSPEARDRLLLQYAPLVKFFAGRAPGDPVKATGQALSTLTAAIDAYATNGPKTGYEPYAISVLVETCPDPYSWDEGWS